MAVSNSSHKRRTKKAGTPNPSTTSSTTAKTSHDKPEQTANKNGQAKKPDQPKEPRTPSEPVLLSSTQQDLFLELLQRGASPLAACQQLGLSVESYLLTHETDAEFARREAQSQDLISQNVVAALYKEAMQGSVSAQTFWLKNHPPPDWVTVNDAAPATEDPLDQLTDDELFNLADALGITVPLEPPPPTLLPSGEEFTGDLPPPTDPAE